MKFSQILKELRLSNKLTQAQLAKAIGVSQGTIYFWENDVNEPSASYIVALSSYFNISADELLGKEALIKHGTELNATLNEAYHTLCMLNKKNCNLALNIINAIYQNQNSMLIK